MRVCNDGSSRALHIRSNPASTRFLHIGFALILAFMLALAGAGCASPNDSGGTPAANDSSGSAAASGSTTASGISVKVTIDCSEAVEAGNATALAIADDKGMLFDETVELEEGATVYDALVATGVTFVSTESSMGSYVSGIGGLSMGDEGEMSGWIYTVNQESVMESANDLKLSDGDSVEWNFVLEPSF